MGGGNYASLTSTSSYLILPAPSVMSVHPSSLSNDMGEDIIVHGSGFLNTDSICCFFYKSPAGEKGYESDQNTLWSAPAIWISWDMVSCRSPPTSYFPKSGSIVKLYVSLNCAQNSLLANEGLPISFAPQEQHVAIDAAENMMEKNSVASYDPIGVSALSLFPQAGPTFGGGTISVQHWEDVGPIWWDSCVYHGSYGSPAVQVPANINGSCAIPEWPYPESVFVELSSGSAIDGAMPIHIPRVRFPFDFVEPPVLLFATPRVLIAQRTQVIHLKVLPLLKPYAGLQCAFVSYDDGITKDSQVDIRDALFISEHEISCTSPPHLSVGNSTRMHLLLHGQPFSNRIMPLGFALTVLPQPVAFKTQLIGSRGTIIVMGESLARFATYLSPKCLFGDRTVPSLPLNDSALICVIGNGEGLYAETETTATSSSIPSSSTDGLFPFAPVRLLLSGRDEIVIPAGEVALLPRPTVLMFTPAEVAEHGGTIVVLGGSHLSGALCRFGDVVIQSYPSTIYEGGFEHFEHFAAIDAVIEIISCKAPPISQVITSSDGQTAQYVALAISTDGGMGYVSVGMVRYSSGALIPVVGSITPSSGHHTGGAVVSVHGRGLRITDAYHCQFVPPGKLEGIVVPGIWVSNTLFQCIAPPLSSGLVSAVQSNISESTIMTSVKVLINGKYIISTNDLYFKYFIAPNPFDVVAAPLVGTTVGGTLVTVSGQKLESMKLIDRGGVSCVFGSASPSLAVEISPDSIACLSPVGTEGMIILKLMSFDGLELFQFSYIYVKPSFVTKADPSTVDASRLPDGFTIIGEDFAVEPDLCCRLVSLSDQPLSIMMDADYLSNDRMWCKFDPELAPKAGSYDVQVCKILPDIKYHTTTCPTVPSH